MDGLELVRLRSNKLSAAVVQPFGSNMRTVVGLPIRGSLHLLVLDSALWLEIGAKKLIV